MAKQELYKDATIYHPLYKEELRKLKNANGQILVGINGPAGYGKSHFLEIAKEEAIKEGWFLVEGKRRMVICKDEESFEKCKSVIALKFIKQLAKKVYIEKYQPSPADEPVFLKDEYMQEELDAWFEQFDLQLPYEVVCNIITTHRLLERSTVFDGWWVRERFFRKTMNAFEEETVNNLKEFFHL